MILFYIFFFLKYTVSAETVSEIVSTSSGDLQGIIKVTSEGVSYTSFKGIPYGEKPKRFQEAEPVKRANHTIQCFNDGLTCLQAPLTAKKIEGSEDCLNLNVYTPLTNFTTEPQKLLPIFFWIHGGAFLTGSADSCKYGPDGLINHGIIVVSINYRLGAFGWTLLQDARLPGDAGLKDQLLALKWVRKNIIYFGGDPERITLAGQSAGSISATAHAISDRSQGLFQQIIALSGVICNSWGYHTQLEAELTAFKLGQMLNNNDAVDTTDELIKLLNETPDELLTLTVNEIRFPPAMKAGMDSMSPNNTAFLKECSHKRLITGNYIPVPTMIGFTQNEALAFIKPLDDIIYNMKKFSAKLKHSKHKIDRQISRFVAKLAKWTTALFEFASISATQLIFHLGVDICQRAMCYSRNPIKTPIYYYLISYDPKEYSYHYQSKNITELSGVGHEDELSLIFEMCPKYLQYPKDPNHPLHLKKKQMRALVANFVKYGNPTPFGNDDPLLKVTWPNSCFGGHHLLIDNDLIVKRERPTGRFIKFLTPFDALRNIFQSDCFEVQRSDPYKPVISSETTITTFFKHFKSFWALFLNND